MDRRGYLLVCFVAVSGALTSGFRELDVDASAPASATEAAELYSIAALGDRDDPYFDGDPRTFSGDGQRRVTEVSIEGGFAVLVGTHEGDGAFAVETGGTGSGVSEAVVGDGPGTYVAGMAMASADYRMDVTADGPWTLTLARPRAPNDEVRRPPATAAGTGDAVVGPIDTTGDILVSGTHQGDGQFTAELVLEGSTGLFVPDMLFDGTGEIEAKSRTVVAGTAWAVVTATGSWRLAFDDSPLE